jgi:hypothetical protein
MVAAGVIGVARAHWMKAASADGCAGTHDVNLLCPLERRESSHISKIQLTHKPDLQPRGGNGKVFSHAGSNQYNGCELIDGRSAIHCRKRL